MDLLTATAKKRLLEAFSRREPVPTSLETRGRKQSVDDSHAALEIHHRSSYVPTFNHRRLIPA
ncbi:hypothetical protein [Bradyrhizobium sp. URHC0002]